MSQRRTRRKQKQGKSDNKNYKTIIDVGSNYLIQKLETKPDGKKTLHIDIKDSKLEHGHTTGSGQFKPALIAPAGEYDIYDIFNFDGYFCFVDTNKLKNNIPKNQDATHITGFYIFRVKKITKYPDRTLIDTDFENSIIRFIPIIAKEGINPELTGWGLAITVLKEIGATKAKIFVDSEQGRLKELNTMLSKGFNLYYTSADRKPTIYNIIFSRLDKLINHTASNLGPTTNLYRAIDYLWGNIDHLPYDKEVNK